MRLGIIGAGNVGSTLGRALGAKGHQVAYGVREPSHPKYASLAQQRDHVLTVREAVECSEAVILATPWAATRDALASAGDFAGKPLLDATNPLGPGLALTVGHVDSGGETVQRWAKTARVVKIFNTTGSENMADPVYGVSRAAMFLCGDERTSCEVARRLAQEIGFDAIVVGPLRSARLLEPLARLWIELAHVQGWGRNMALGLLRQAMEGAEA